MKKHIIGLALFSFIVSATAVVYAIFNVPEIISVSAPQHVPAERTNCKMKRKTEESNFGSSIIKQAVFNLKTKQFSWELVKQKVDTPLDLHFFIKDEKGTRYAGTEQDKNSVKYEGLYFSSSCIWIDNLDSYENLYVVAEPSSTSGNYKKHQPIFDANKATPVSLDYGK